MPSPHQDERTDRVYAFIRDYLAGHGYAPSLREIAAGCGIGLATLMRHLDRLEEQGRIARVPHLARSITLTEQP